MLIKTSLGSKLEYTYSFDTGRLWDPNSVRYRSDDTFDLRTRTEMMSDAVEAVNAVLMSSNTLSDQKKDK